MLLVMVRSLYFFEKHWFSLEMGTGGCRYPRAGEAADRTVLMK